MESRRKSRRDPGMRAEQDIDPIPAEPTGDPAALVETAEEEPATQPVRRRAPRGRSGRPDDDPRVVVTHSLGAKPPPAPAKPQTPEEDPVGDDSEVTQGGDATAEADVPEAEFEEPDGAPAAEVEPAPVATLAPSAAAPEPAPVEAQQSAAAEPEPPAALGPEPEPAAPVLPSGTRFSPDGEWWWNGRVWYPAVSDDGLWRWDGAHWQLQVASGLDPERLVDGLKELADVRYRRRGLLLARHANDWPVPPNLTQAVAEATVLLEQRTGVERRLNGGGRRRPGLLSRVSGDDDEQRGRNELANLDRQLDPRLLKIGREAPVGTFRESDEVLQTAQHLSGSAQEVTGAHEAVLAAQAEWQARVAGATKDLEQRITERDARIAEAEVGVREAEAQRERRIADAWRRLAEVRMPGKGEHLASFGSIHLFGARVEMPNAAGPAAGARAVIGSAAELTQAEPGPLEDLFLVGDSGAADLHWAETNGDPAPYLLVMTESGAALVACGENESEARRFARQLTATAATADAMREARRARLTESRESVQQAEDDHSEIEAATAHRTATEQDPDLLGAIEKARDQLAFERQETTDIDQTGADLQAVLDRLTTAPDPLPPPADG